MPDLHVGRVLLVEQPDGRDMLKWALEENGFEVDLANDGESALAIAAARAPAVVIADIILPGMDGWELAHRLRGIYGAAMRLVALTALGDPEDRAHSATAGFNVHLVKPVRPGKVHDTILNLLAPRQMPRPALQESATWFGHKVCLRSPGMGDIHTLKSILIADGDERVAQVFAEVFASHGWHVTTCRDSRRAGEDLRGRAHYDAVLVGYRFEGVDGVDLIKQIRALDHRQDVPIVMVTGVIEVSIMAAALTAGADDVLYKPADVAIVVATVNKCVESRRQA